MADETPFDEDKAPDVFSRGSLKLTYDLIRNKDALLALNIRNIMHTEPLPKEAADIGNEHSDRFKVDLDSLQVRAIVEGLAAQVPGSTDDKTNPGKAVLVKTLVEDWMKLARKMIEELPDDQKPSATYH